MGPRISVLLPAYQAESTLGTCLASLARQTETRWECVLVDDGSTDRTLAVARDFARHDPRVRVVSTAHRGLVRTLRTGLAECRGDLVARMDADDWMHRDRLCLQREALDTHPELAALGCHVRLFPRSTLRDGMRRYEAWLNGQRDADDIRRDAFVECPIAHPTLMARRQILDRFGYRDEGWPEDYDLVLRLLTAGEAIGVVPRRLLAWREGPERLSRSAPAYAQERFTACKAAHLAASLLARSREYVLWGYGDTGRALRRALLAHGRVPSHIVELHPGRLGQRIHGAPVVGPEALGALGATPVVASVAGAEARNQIRAALRALGRREGRDFVCAA